MRGVLWFVVVEINYWCFTLVNWNVTFEFTQIDKVPVKSDKSTVYSEYTIYANATDNEAIYKCEASNLATDIPLFKTVKLNVYCE